MSEGSDSTGDRRRRLNAVADPWPEEDGDPGTQEVMISPSERGEPVFAMVEEQASAGELAALRSVGEGENVVDPETGVPAEADGGEIDLLPVDGDRGGPARKTWFAAGIVAAALILGALAVKQLGRVGNLSQPGLPASSAVTASKRVGGIGPPGGKPVTDRPGRVLPVTDAVLSRQKEGPKPPGLSGKEPPTERDTPAATIQRIDWQRENGGTVVTIGADGRLQGLRVRHLRMDDPPRFVIRVLGITRAFPVYEIPVGTSELKRIRVGYHPELSPPELYVVLDLAGSAITVKEPVFDQRGLRVSLQTRLIPR